MSKEYRLEWIQDGVLTVDYFDTLIELKLKYDVLRQEGYEPFAFADPSETFRQLRNDRMRDGNKQ